MSRTSRGNSGEKSRLTQAWHAVRKAKDKAETSKKRPHDDTDLDAILGEDELERIESLFWNRYRIKVAPERLPSDYLVSRVYKELTRRCLTVREVLSTKTVQNQMAATSKRHQVSTNLALVENMKLDESKGPATVTNYLQCLRILMMAYAKAGSIPVFPPPQAKGDRFADPTDHVVAPMDIMMAYYERAEEAVTAIPERNRYQWLRATDVAERSKWVQMIRTTQLPFGKIVHTPS